MSLSPPNKRGTLWVNQLHEQQPSTFTIKQTNILLQQQDWENYIRIPFSYIIKPYIYSARSFHTGTHHVDRLDHQQTRPEKTNALMDKMSLKMPTSENAQYCSISILHYMRKTISLSCLEFARVFLRITFIDSCEALFARSTQFIQHPLLQITLHLSKLVLIKLIYTTRLIVSMKKQN